jgi:hypothetical protein
VMSPIISAFAAAARHKSARAHTATFIFRALFAACSGYSVFAVSRCTALDQRRDLPGAAFCYTECRARVGVRGRTARNVLNTAADAVTVIMRCMCTIKGLH